MTDPGVTPATIPVEVFTVAKAVFELDQSPLLVELVKVVIPFEQTVFEPAIAFTVGKDNTATEVGSVVALQPLVAVIVTE